MYNAYICMCIHAKSCTSSIHHLRALRLVSYVCEIDKFDLVYNSTKFGGVVLPLSGKCCTYFINLLYFRLAQLQKENLLISRYVCN